MTLLMNDCAVVENKLFFVSRKYGLLCELNLETKEIKILDLILEKSENREIIDVRCVAYYGETLFVVPNGEKKVLRYDLKGNKSGFIDFDNKINIFGSIVYKDRLFLVGCTMSKIIIIDSINERISYEDSVYIDIVKRIKNKQGAFFRSHYVLLNNVAYIASCIDNFVLKLNLETMDHDWIKVGDEDDSYSGIAWDGKSFWIAPRMCNDILCWDGKNDVKRICIAEKDYLSDGCFLGVVVNKGKAIFPNEKDKFSIEVDFENHKYSIINKQYCLYKQIDDDTIVRQTTDGKLELVYGNYIKSFEMRLGKKDIDRFCKKEKYCFADVFKTNEIYIENNEFEIEGYIGMVINELQNK